MKNSNSIESQLAKAGLPARVVENARDVNKSFLSARPDGRPNPFLMDIRRDGKKGEVFVIRPGDAEVRIVNTDKKLQQAILFVGEKESEVTFRTWDSSQRKAVMRTNKIKAEKRHFLMGMDESHLFICRLPTAAATVSEAHRILAPDEVRDRRSRKEKVLRQGEWFFTPINRSVIDIESLIKEHGIYSNHRIGPVGRRGRAHIADQMIRVPHRVFYSAQEMDAFKRQLDERRFGGFRMPDGTRVSRVGDIPKFRVDFTEYVCGSIRHPDHRVLKLADWHSVAVNTERTEEIAPGMTWVD